MLITRDETIMPISVTDIMDIIAPFKLFFKKNKGLGYLNFYKPLNFFPNG